jgi:hypothetical protein
MKNKRQAAPEEFLWVDILDARNLMGQWEVVVHTTLSTLSKPA